MNLDQPQSNKNIKIKIEKPLFHSRQISEQNILHKSNSNRPSITKSVHNLNQIKNLKKQFANPQNSIKINIDNGGKRKQILINSRSCILKPDQLKKEYNYNEIIMNHNKNSINALKNTISQITLTKNDESKEKEYPPYKQEIEMIRNKKFDNKLIEKIRLYYG